MANIANIVIKDSTGADRTFSPQSVTAGTQAAWQETASGIRVGFPVIVASQRAPGVNARTTRTTITLGIPVLEVTAGSTGSGYQAAPKIAYRDFVKIEVVSSERSTALQRADLRSLAYNLLNNTQVTAMLLNYEMPT